MSPRPTLAALLRRRSRREVVAFVAELYDARGATTRVDAGVVVVDGDRLLVVSSGAIGRLRERFVSASTPVDAVVAVDASRVDVLEARYDVPVITPTDLDHLARYGLDRTVADRLFEDSFGRSVADVAPPSATLRSTDAPTTATTARSPPNRTDGSRRSQSVVVAVLVVAALAAFAVAVPASLDGGVTALPGLGGSSDAADGTASGAAADEVGVANEPRPTTTPTSDALRLAPGLSVAGVTDAEALADAHAKRLANRSYTWELTYVEFANGNESGRATETVMVERPSKYVTNVSTDGFLSSRGPISFQSSYADGEQRYRPTADGLDATPIARRGDTGLQEVRASRYYEILLDGEETSVVRTILGEPRLYVVDIQGTSASSVRNYTATAHVEPDGTIVYYSGSYCFVSLRSDNGRETCLTVTMQYRNVGQTTVDPPSWYTTATANTTSTTAETTETTSSTPAPTADANATASPATETTPATTDQG